MTNIRFLRAAPFLLLAGVALAACGSDGGGAPSNPADNVWQQLQACNLTGDYRVNNASQSICEDWPVANETLSIEREGDSAFLRAGLVRLPIALGEDECTFVAAGCASTPASADGSTQKRYFEPKIEISGNEEGIFLVTQAVDIVGHSEGYCGKQTFSATPVVAGGCNPLGGYTAKDASIPQGYCDLTWGPGDVKITKNSDGYVVDWAGTEIDDLKLDKSTCTLSGSKGKELDYWSYNNAMRLAQIELRVTDTGLTGTVKDQLDGPTFDGKECPGATFKLSASLPPKRTAHTLEATCSAPVPSVCGNGVCEEGESCTECSDCVCAADEECAPDGVCRETCTLQTESTACDAGERCSQIKTGNDVAIFEYDKLYCETAGAGKRGDLCDRTSACGAGLICHIPEKGKQGMCSPPCGEEGLPECTNGDVCGGQGTGSGLDAYPFAIDGCEHQAGPAEDCKNAACVSGYFCLKICPNDVCSNYCTKKCGSSWDCPDELPVCDEYKFCVAK